MKKLRNIDHEYEQKFQVYHLEHAKLRWLCQNVIKLYQKSDFMIKKYLSNYTKLRL